MNEEAIDDELNMEQRPAPNEEDEDIFWSIGIYTGETLLDLKSANGTKNPVIAIPDVSDMTSELVADPFMIKEGGAWYLFFETSDATTHKGAIGLATSENGLVWDYQRIVLRESFHLSYPYVFRLDGEFYMIPESYQANAAILYQADSFPGKWSPVTRLIEGEWLDSSIFFHGNRWWLFTCEMDSDDAVLELFYSDGISGPWRRHKMSPIIRGDNQIARPAGRVIEQGGRIIRFAQACYPHYGLHVRAFEITELTTSTYSERELDRSPILSGGEHSWNRGGMHHIDAHFVNGKWFACVDGWRIE